MWSPEIVDKAILHSERIVDGEEFVVSRGPSYELTDIFLLYAAKTGVISYNGKSKAIFTTHAVEKPYLIYQIGSSDPDLAVQAKVSSPVRACHIRIAWSCV